MQRMLTYATVTIVALLAAGCGSGNFLVYKDSRSFNITSTSPELRLVLCDTGDMDRIVRDSALPAPLQKALKDCMCAAIKDKELLISTLDGMTKKQLTALKDAFRKNGYDINKIADS